MSQDEVNRHSASLEEPKRSTPDALRRTILDIVPEAEQCISYGLPAFRLRGKVTPATWPISVYLIVLGVITFVAAIAAPETAGKELN
jgi:hypothetical protein